MKDQSLPLISKMGGYHVGGQTVALRDFPLENVTLQAGQPPRAYDPNGNINNHIICIFIYLSF